MNEFRELFLALHIYEQGQFYQSLDEKPITFIQLPISERISGYV